MGYVEGAAKRWGLTVDQMLKRDKEIRQRFQKGESQQALAKAYGIGQTRVHQIVRGTG